MKIGINWDEAWPLFDVEDNLEYADSVAEVTREWLEEYRVAARTFWAMQGELRELSGYEG
jgi:hypothetical protein